MTEAERENRISADDQKQKIRERYRGVDPDTLDVIPAAPKADIFEPGCRQRDAVYARVSTDDPRQTSSYELQKNYYEDMVNRNPMNPICFPKRRILPKVLKTYRKTMSAVSSTHLLIFLWLQLFACKNQYYIMLPLK